MKEILSKATRNEFREAFTYFSLSEIETMFDAGELSPDTQNCLIVRSGAFDVYGGDLKPRYGVSLELAHRDTSGRN